MTAPAPEPGLSVGEVVTVDIGPIAHGGHCVARHEGQVLFVRHTLPGERVRARVTEVGSGSRFVRADAIEVVSASPDRVPAPCRYAGVCGGCDLQHVDLAAQRRLKATVVREQLQRLARLDIPVEVEALAGDRDGLRWRTRTEFAVGPEREIGMRPHRSHHVLPVDDCLIAREEVIATGVLHRPAERVPADVVAFDVIAPSVGEPVVVPVTAQGATGAAVAVTEVVEAGGFRGEFEVAARGFWQVHPGAAGRFVVVAVEMLAPRAGERVLDLYSGVGVFAAALADAVGPTGQVIAVESDVEASAHAQANLAAYDDAVVVRARVDEAFGITARRSRGPQRRGSRGGRGRPGTRHPLIPPTADLVLLDPPRTGAAADVCRAVAALSPRAIVYVACDPAALARDLATFADSGYAVRTLRAFDAFPMTHHVECIVLLER